ncbi:MAG TPA: Hsp20/alpha crystallin family protein [Bacteroidia bacterium]|nr:Hsp20/alpha crystallin family protein [Bacteroidia bacterium]
MKESDTAYTLELAAPGLAKEDFKIRVEENTLTISGEKKQEQNEKTEKYSRKEFSFTSFTRSFTLPENVNMEGIQANYNHGIMMVVLPKTEPAKPKSKEISIG